MPVKFVQSERLTGTVEPGPPMARLEVDGIGFGIVIGSGIVIGRGDADELPFEAIQLRKFAEHYAYDRALEHSEAGEGKGSGRSRRTRLPDQVCHLTLLVWQLLQWDERQAPVLGSGGLVGRIALPGGEGWSSQLQVAGNEDPGYWTVPDWEEFDDYFQFQYAWGKLLDQFPPGTSRGKQWLEYFALSHIEIVGSIQSHRRIPGEVFSAETKQLKAVVEGPSWSGELDRRARTVMTELKRALLPPGQLQTVRTQDFRTWLESFFPLIAVPLGPSHALAKRIIETWHELDFEGVTGTRSWTRSPARCPPGLIDLLRRRKSRSWRCSTRIERGGSRRFASPPAADERLSGLGYLLSLREATSQTTYSPGFPPMGLVPSSCLRSLLWAYRPTVSIDWPNPSHRQEQFSALMRERLE